MNDKQKIELLKGVVDHIFTLTHGNDFGKNPDLAQDLLYAIGSYTAAVQRVLDVAEVKNK